MNLETSQLHPTPLISALWSGERALPCPCSDSPSLLPTPVIACAELSIGASRIDSYKYIMTAVDSYKYIMMTKIGSRRLSPSLPPIRLTHLEPQLQRFDDLRDRDQQRGRVRDGADAEREPAELLQRVAVRRRRAGKDAGASTVIARRVEMAARTI